MLVVSGSYLVDPKIVIKIYNFSTLHKNMYVLKYSILNSFAQNPAISTFFRKVHFYQLNERINWSVIEEDFKKLYSLTGRPAKPVRLMVSLLLLKQLEDLSDEQGIRRWVDIPYWQYLSGEPHFQWKPPAASSDLTHFRKRIGKKGAERLLKLSIDLFNPKIQKEEVVIDTTVQEKNITYPTDSKLAKKVIDTCRNIAKQEGIPLRQSYSRVTPQLLRQASNRKSPHQKIKARKATRRVQTIGRALVRELVRKMPKKQIRPYAQCLEHPASKQNR